MRFDQCTETCTTDCGHCKDRPVEALRADNERLSRRLAGRFEETEKLRAEVAFWREQRDLAANVAAGIADLDEEAPALRQMLRTEKQRREAEEATSLAAEVERDKLGIEVARLRQQLAEARVRGERWRRLAVDLTRCEHGRVQLDTCSQCPQGYAPTRAGRPVGYSLDGTYRVVVPIRADQADPDAWYVLAESLAGQIIVEDRTYEKADAFVDFLRAGHEQLHARSAEAPDGERA